MEKNYNTDNFEQLLRETTDEFRMYPSRRVWHSLYNDLHPGRKWPSVAVLLLLITSIMYVGVTNTNNAATTAIAGSVANTSLASNNIVSPDKNNLVNNNSTKRSQTVIVQSALSADDIVLNNVAGSDLNNTGKTGIKAFSTSQAINTEADISSGKLINKTNSLFSSAPVETEIDEKDQSLSFTSNGSAVISITNGSAGSESSADLLSSAPKKMKATVTDPVRDMAMSADERSRMEDFALHNKKPARKWKNRIAYQVYVTPSVGYRNLTLNTDFAPPPVSTLISNPAQTNAMEYKLNHASAINLEAGTSMIFSFSKKIRLKAGLQLNYTNYRIGAYELNHPTFTTIMLNDLNNGYPVLTSRSTTLANTPGRFSKNLNNNTYQVSVPLGADFKILGNNQLKWYAGATIQPTYVAGGHAYLVSSDLKNYVDGDDMMRKFNLNAGVETFVSYKTKNGIVISAGPQVRYQFLSTYSKSYTYDEKLYNLGIKLGMTTRF